MSHYTHIGAIVVPAETEDPFVFFDENAPGFRGSSRSGHFQSTIRTLLDLAPEYQSLRFLSAETATKEARSADGTTSFTLLHHAELVVVENELRQLLAGIPRHIDSFPTDLLSYWGGAGRIRDAVQKARSLQGSGHQLPDDDDGDSPDFFFTVLSSLGGLCRVALDGACNLLIYNWRPR